MTFLEALKTGRPMRRRGWSIGAVEYIGRMSPRWRELITRRVVDLEIADYLAEDWEALP